MATKKPNKTRGLTPWKKGQSGNPAGRAKKILTILKESGYTKADALHVFKEIGWKNRKQIEAILKNDKQPLIVHLVARCFINAINKAEYGQVKEILQYVIGTPQQNISIEHTGEVDMKQKIILDGKTYEL